MSAGRYDFTIEQGAKFTKTITWKDAANAAINLTGYSARLQVRQKPSSSTVILELSTANSGITLGGATGVITLQLSAAASSALDFTAGVYQLELTPAVGDPVRLLRGVVTLDKEVVR